MDDGYLDDFISLNEKGHRQRDEWAARAGCSGSELERPKRGG